MKVEEIRELFAAAHAEVSAVCKGKEWRMCIPVRKDDSDILIGGAISKADKLLDVFEFSSSSKRKGPSCATSR